MSLDNKAIVSLVKKNPILAACIVVGLGLAVIIYARSGSDAEQQSELDRKTEEGKRYHANLANSAQLTDELQAVTEANRLVRERAVNPADLAKNLQYFYRIEAETGVKFIDLRQLGSGGAASTGTKRVASVYIPVNYTISVEGEFSKIITFLRNLERGAHFYRLNTMTASEAAGSTKLVLNIDLLGKP
ncbi:MAG: hypothetical protein WC661_14980 [Opitutaceae bacterium]|jgi:hypothetical protein